MGVILELARGYWKIKSIEEVKGYSEERNQFKYLRPCGVIFAGRGYEIKYINKNKTRIMRMIYRPGGNELYRDRFNK